MDIEETPGPHLSPQPWRSIVAGAVAGGLIAASVAVPATWLLSRQEDALAPATAGAAPPARGTTPQQPRSLTATDTTASDAESRGLVLIDTTLTDGEAAGTGLVIDSAGLVLTNYHVVEGSTSARVTIASDGTSYDATVVGHDQRPTSHCCAWTALRT